MLSYWRLERLAHFYSHRRPEIPACDRLPHKGFEIGSPLQSVNVVPFILFDEFPAVVCDDCQDGLHALSFG